MIRQLQIQLDLNSGQFSSKITTASGQVQNFTNSVGGANAAIVRMERRITGLGATLRDLVVTISQVRGAFFTLHHVSTQWIASIIRQNAEIERLTHLMAGLSTEMTQEARFADAERNVQKLIDLAKNAPFSLQTLSDAFVKMKAGGIDPTSGALQSLVDAVAAFGGTEQHLQRASIAIQQMAGKGVVSMEELRQQLGEAVPSAVRQMAIGMGMTYGELVERISLGQVKANGALQKMLAQFELSFGGRAQAMMTTFNGLLARLQTTYTEFALRAGRAGAFDAIKTQLRDLIAFLESDSATRFAQVLGKGIADVTEALRASLEWIYRYRDELIALGQMLLAVWAGGKVIGLIGGVSAAIMGLAGAHGILTTATATYHRVAYASLGVLINLRIASVGLAQTFGVVAAAAGVFARAVSLLAGPVGIAVAVLWTLADVFGVFDSRASKAKEAIQEFQDGPITKDGVEAVKNRVAEIKGELETLYRVAQNPRNTANQTQIALNRIAPLEKELETLTAALSNAEKEMERTAVDKAVRDKLAGITREVENARGTLAQAQIAYEKQLEQNAAIDDRNLRRDADSQARETYIAAVKAFYDRQLEIIAASQAQAAQMTDSGTGQLTAAGQALIDQLRQQEAQVRESMRRTLETLNAANQFTTDPDTPGGLRNIETALDNYRARIAEIQAELKGTSGELGKVRSLLGNDVFKATTAEERAELERLASTYDTLRQKLDEQVAARQRSEQAWTSIQSRYAQTQDRIRQLTADILAADNIFEPRGLRSAIAALDEFGRRLAAGSEEARKFAEQRGGMEDALRQEFALEQLQGLAEETRSINRSLLDDERRARNDALIEETQRLQRLVELSGLAGEERKLIEQQVQDYIRALRDQVARENETAGERQVRLWQDVTKRMEEATADWTRDAIDTMTKFVTTGKAKIGELVESILEQFVRIQLQKTIGGPLQALFDAGVAALGAYLGGGGDTLSAGTQAQIDAGIGPGLGEIHHTGGIVGRENMVPLDQLFSNAKRFHKGGFPGLRRDEVPTILKKGEGVFTPEQMRALGKAGQPNVQVNVINQSGLPMGGESNGPRFDGEQMVLDVVLKHASRPGAFRNNLNAAFGRGS